MIGTTLSHFRITAKLGEGGMGEVYRAEDTKLGREVAIKVLPEEMASDPERLERFEREARAVAALNHPHIVTIHSVEEVGGVHFLTMELIDGRSLDKLIPSSGLDVEKFFELATPLAEAISAAHEKSVIHRDLKPSNVMVDGDGRIKVLDFGLAKLQGGGEISDSSELLTEALTGVGMIVGTVPYMSPEQIEGKLVDHRTDIFSLGILLYEMATGDRPFQGDSQPALMSSILKDVPQSAVDLRQDLPRHLGRIISRCLEKDCRDRYQTARDVYNELKSLNRELSGTSVASVQSPSGPAGREAARSRAIAVVPFRTSSSNEELTALAEGLAEDVAAGVARFPYLTVVDGDQLDPSGDSTATARGRGVRYLLRGGLRGAGPEVRLSLQLVDAETGAHVWSEAYNKRLEGASLFELQDELTDRIVSTIGDYSGVLPRLVLTELRAMNKDQMTDDDWIMRAVCFNQVVYPPEEHAAIRDGLEAVIARNPNHAEAHAWLASMYRTELTFQYNLRENPIERSMRAAQRAVDLDPASQAGWDALAAAHYFLGDLPAFEAAALRAIALNPRNSLTTAWMGMLIGYSGQWERGSELGLKACALNPHHPEWYLFTTFYLHYGRREYEEAFAVAKRIHWPQLPYSHINVAAVCGQLGRPEEARASIEALRQTFGFDLARVREEYRRWRQSEDLTEHIVDGLLKAGFERDADPPPASGVLPFSQFGAKPVEDSAFDVKSIAVLPFTDMSPARDQDWFCEGVAEEILNALAALPELRVATRTAAFRFKDQDRDIAAIGETLGVTTLLEGSVRTAGDRLRVTAQLVNSRDGYQLWSEKFDREMADVFEIQDEIATKVVEALELRMLGSEEVGGGDRHSADLEAYHLFLKGRHARYSKLDMKTALKCFEAAVRRDPSYSLARIGLAEVLVVMSMYGFVPPHEGMKRARQELQQAEDTGMESAEAWAVEGLIRLVYTWNTSSAHEAFDRAIELNPASVTATAWRSWALVVDERSDEAFDQARGMVALDPQSSYTHAMATVTSFLASAHEDAIRLSEIAVRLEPESLLATWVHGVAHAAVSRWDEADEWLGRAVEHSGRAPVFLGLLAWCRAASGQRDSAGELLAELEDRSATEYVSPYFRLWAESELEDAERAPKLLEEALAERASLLAFAGFPPNRKLREEPLMQDLHAKLASRRDPDVPS